MLIKRKSLEAGRGKLSAVVAGQSNNLVDRRSFLKTSGLAAGALATLGPLGAGSIRKAQAAGTAETGVELKKNICTHCSVGCTVIAEVKNGVWVGQEPAWASPINRGSHCAKGAAVRELVHGDRRLKYPMKLIDGKWQRLSWQQAIDEIGDKLLKIREVSGPDSVFWLGSAKFSNEGSYLFRKLAAFWGTNSVDHQARICHSTTVAGVANVWGYGAMTNSYNDIRKSKTQIIMGGNPAEAHPVSLQHLLAGKEMNRANVIVIDPRLTRTAAHATEYVRIRPGTDIPVIWGMLWHIFENGWEDKEFISQRVYGMTTSARKSPNGTRRKSSASPACQASSSSASPRCSRRKSRPRSSGAWARRRRPSARPTSAPSASRCSRPATSAPQALAPISSVAIAMCRARRISASMS